MQTPWTWLQNRSRAEEAIGELTNQFYVTLRAYMARIRSTGAPRSAEAYEQIEKLLDPDRTQSWSDCYEIEQLMVHLYDDEMLRAELNLRTIEARNLRPVLTEYYLAMVKEATTSDQQRALLVRLVNDLQWHYTVNESKRRFARTLTSRTGWFFLLAFLTFGVVSYFFWTHWLHNCSDMGLFSLAILAGAWGATFSMLTSLKGRIDESGIYDLRSTSAYVMLLSRALIGAGAAAILYYFLRSEVVAGSAFPTLTGKDAACGIDGKGLALLVVWCFLAGFSEKLVPGLLAKTEAKADGATDRFKPSPESRDSPAASVGPAKPKGGTGTPEAGAAAATDQRVPS